MDSAMNGSRSGAAMRLADGNGLDLILGGAIDGGPAQGGAGELAAAAGAGAGLSPDMDAQAGGTDSYSANANQVLNVPTASGLLANDPGASASYLFTSPSNGTIMVNADGSFVYTPDEGFLGVDTFYYQNNLDPDPILVSITVNTANIVPVTGPAGVTIDEDSNFVFGVSDFPFSDADNNALAGIVISELPVGGRIWLGEAPVSLGQFITLVDLQDGFLSFRPDQDLNGAAAASFKFQVRDDSGSTGGDNSAEATFTFDITATNDAPRIELPAGQLTALTEGANVYNVSMTGDGNLVVFSTTQALVAGDTNNAADIYLLNRATGDYTKLTDLPAGASVMNLAISANGATVAFMTGGALLPDDTNGLNEIYVIDVATGTLSRGMLSTEGWQPSGYSMYDNFVLSADGTKLAIQTSFFDLVQNDTNSTSDVFVKDLVTGVMERVSVYPNGAQVFAQSLTPFFSADGTKLGFVSEGAIDSGNNDTNGIADLYVRDLATGLTTRVEIRDVNNNPYAGYYAQNPAFSPDGTKIIFNAYDDSLTAGDSNGVRDVYIIDIATGTITLVSTTDTGGQSNGPSYSAFFTPDGTRIIFASNATNLIDGDPSPSGVIGLYMKDLITGEVTRLSVDADGAPSPYWWVPQGISADGTQLLLRSQDPLLPGNAADGSSDAYMLDLSAITPRYVDGHGAVKIAPGANVFDIDSSDFGGGSLSVEIVVGGEASDLLSILMSNVPGRGIEVSGSDLFFNGVHFGTFTSSPGLLQANFDLDASIAAVKALVGAIGFARSSNDPSAQTRIVQFFLDDGDGGESPSMFQQHVEVVSLSQAPTGTDTVVALNEDDSYTVALADFGFGDVNDDTLVSVVITGLPGHGTLTLDGGLVAPGQEISAQDIADGKLVYTPEPDGQGDAFDRFGFKVRDSGSGSSGSLVGGTNLDSRTHFVTFDVANVNDAPVVSGTAPVAELLSRDYLGNAMSNGSNAGILSADGTKLLFASYDDASGEPAGNVSEVYVRDLNTGAVTLVSTDVNGVPADGYVGRAIFSADGTKIAFISSASNLVPGGTNGEEQVYVKNLLTGEVTLASMGSNGEIGTGAYFNGDFAFSPDGTKLVFSTVYDNLVPGDTNGTSDVFMKDLVTGTLVRVSVEANGVEFPGTSVSGAFSPDGNRILIQTQIVPGSPFAIIEKDLLTGSIRPIAQDSAGGVSYSADGTRILYTSRADDTGAGDSNGQTDVFVLDLVTNTRTLVSVAQGGLQGDDMSVGAVFSPDGTRVLFYSQALNFNSSGSAGYYVKDLLTGDLVMVLADPYQTGFQTASFSPDGTHIIVNGYFGLDPADQNSASDTYSVALNGLTSRYVDGRDPVRVAPGVTLSDVDSADFDGGSLQVWISLNANGGDQVKVGNSGGITVVGSDVLYRGVSIGTLSGNDILFTVSFNSGATLEAVKALAEAVTFSSTSHHPQEYARTIQFTFDDGDGGPSTAVFTRDVVALDASVAPTGIDSTLTIDEDVNYVVLTAADFGFSDGDGDSFTGVYIDHAPENGYIMIDGTEEAVTDGTFISAADILAGNVFYRPFMNENGAGYAHIVFRVADNGSTQSGGQNIGLPNTLTIDVTPVNDAPQLGLDEFQSTYRVVEFDEQAGYGVIAPDGIVVDIDSDNFDGGSLTVSFGSNGTGDDALGIVESLTTGISIDGSDVIFGGQVIGTVSGGANGDPLVVQFTQWATPGAVQALLTSISYQNLSQDPAATRDVFFSLTDGDGGTSDPALAVINITPFDDPVAGANDASRTFENETVNIDVRANDIDPDGGAAETITQVAGQAIAAGGTIVLASGATVTLNLNGTLTYNPNGKYDWLISPEKALATGASNSSVTETFSYSLSGGGSATVSVLVTGVDGPGDQLRGTAGTDILTGTSGTDFFDLREGGSDSASGGNGDDGFFMGNRWDSGDVLNGGAGYDQVGVQGTTTVVLGANSLTGIETLVFLPGSDTRFGDVSGALYSYDITMHDGNVAARQTLTVQANTLRAGETLTFDGSAETDGGFIIFGGLGTDILTGGQQTDGFFFGSGRFGADDVIDGQGGIDQLGLQGDYSGLNAISFGANQLTSIEFIVLLSGADTRFNSGGSLFNYQLGMDDGNVAAGETLTIQANTLRAGESLYFDGVFETDGHFRIYSGAGDDTIYGGWLSDEIWGGAGVDFIVGSTGADLLHGGAGNDLFVYTDYSESTAAERDHIFDFEHGDLIDVGRAGFDTFVTGAFGNNAGEVRAVWTGATWLVEGDYDGDGVADLSIQVDQSADFVWTADDFRFFVPPRPAAGIASVEPGDDMARVAASSLFSGEAATNLADDGMITPGILMSDPLAHHHP